MALPDELSMEGMLAWQERFALTAEEERLGGFFPTVPNEVSGNNVSWEVLDRTRDVARFTAYNQPGRERALMVRTVSATQAPTSREQKRIPGSYIQWLRAPGERLRAQGRAAVDRELQDLVDMARRRQELLRSQVFTNTMSMDVDGNTINVTVGIPSGQLLATVAVSWATASTDIITDIRTQMQVIEQTGGVRADTLLCSTEVIGYLLNNDTLQALLSETGKEQLRTTGSVKPDRIPGLDLTIMGYSAGYVPASSGTFTRFVAADSCVLFSSAGIMGQTIECSSPDAGAGTEQRGLFTHAWETDEPPRGVRASAELTALPVCQNPSGIVRWTDVTAT